MRYVVAVATLFMAVLCGASVNTENGLLTAIDAFWAVVGMVLVVKWPRS